MLAIRKATPILLILMAALICGQFALNRGRRTASQATTSPVASLKVYVAVPTQRRITSTGPVASEPNRETHVTVVIENVSSTPQGILDEWNSFGYFNLKLEFTMPDSTKKLMHKNERVMWTRNFPSSTMLQPGEVTFRTVFFDPKIWDDMPADLARVEVKAIFHQELQNDPWVPEPVWRGTIESPLIQLD